MTELYLDPKPLLDAARGGRPWHTEPHCVSCTRNVTSDQALCITITEVAELLDVSTKTIHGWRAGTGRRVRGRSADRLAVACGLLDFEIWPELLDDVIVGVTRTCELDECPNEFIPTKSTHRYCSVGCLEQAPHRREMKARINRERQREQYQTDPQFRDAQIAKARAYRAQYGDRINARKRRARAERRNAAQEAA